MIRFIRSLQNRKFHSRNGITAAICGMAIFLTGATGYVQVSSENLFSSRDARGRTLGCAIINGKILAGKISAQGFLPETASVTAMKARLKTMAASKKPAMKKKIAAAAKKAKADGILCTRAHTGEPPPPTPSGGSATPTPRPRATATPPASGSGCFGLNGSASSGSNIWAGYCSGCHPSGSKNGRSCSQLASSMGQGPMAGVHMSNQQIADLYVYLH